MFQYFFHVFPQVRLVKSKSRTQLCRIIYATSVFHYSRHFMNFDLWLELPRLRFGYPHWGPKISEMMEMNEFHRACFFIFPISSIQSYILSNCACFFQISNIRNLILIFLFKKKRNSLRIGHAFNSKSFWQFCFCTEWIRNSNLHHGVGWRFYRTIWFYSWNSPSCKHLFVYLFVVYKLAMSMRTSCSSTTQQWSEWWNFSLTASMVIPLKIFCENFIGHFKSVIFGKFVRPLKIFATFIFAVFRFDPYSRAN